MNKFLVCYLADGKRFTVIKTFTTLAEATAFIMDQDKFDRDELFVIPASTVTP